MARVRVPSKYRKGLQCLAQLTDDAVNDLFVALETYPVRLYPSVSDVFEHISAKTKIASEADTRLVLDAILSMYPVLTLSNKPLGELTSEIVESMRDHESADEPVLVDTQLARLNDSLSKLLKIPSLSLAVKATGILLQNERSLIASRILTDVRPVFDIDSDDIGGGLVIHTLKLEYISENDEEPQQFFVSLDSDDIEDLIRHLERAKQKATKLKKLLTASSITCIDTDER